MADEPSVTHTAAGAADFTRRKLAPFCFSVHKVPAPSLARLLLTTTLCVEAEILSLNVGEESEAQRNCVTCKRSHSPQVAEQSSINREQSDAFLGLRSCYN